MSDRNPPSRRTSVVIGTDYSRRLCARMTLVKFASDIERLRQGEPVLVDGDHHSQRRYTRKLRRAVAGSVEMHIDAATMRPVDTFDAAMSPAGTATIVYTVPMADPTAAFGTAVPPRR